MLTMPEPRPVALVGELLATQAKGRGVAALLVDAAVRDVEELRELGLPIWARYVRVRGAEKRVPGAIGEPVEVGGATIRQGDVVVLDADGAVVVEQERVDEVLAAARARAEREREKRAKLEAGELSYDLDGLRELVGAVTEPLHDVARIGHAELLTPKPEESLRFFVDVLGMEEEAREGQSVFLRGWGDYLRYSLKLTESPQAGLGHVALRAWSPEALDRRVAAIEASGLGLGLDRRRRRPRPGVPLHGSRRARLRALLRGRALRGARAPAAVVEEPAAALRRPRRGGQAARPRQRARGGRAREPRRSRRSVLGYRLYERIELDDGTETGAWLSLSIAAHELIYVADALRRDAAGSTTSRSGSTRARSACARPTSSSTTTSPSRRRPRSTGSHRASSCTGSSPAATGSR